MVLNEQFIFQWPLTLVKCVFNYLICIVLFVLYSEQTCTIPGEEEDQVDLTDKKHMGNESQQKTF